MYTSVIGLSRQFSGYLYTTITNQDLLYLNMVEKDEEPELFLLIIEGEFEYKAR